MVRTRRRAVTPGKEKAREMTLALTTTKSKMFHGSCERAHSDSQNPSRRFDSDGLVGI